MAVGDPGQDIQPQSSSGSVKVSQTPTCGFVSQTSKPLRFRHRFRLSFTLQPSLTKEEKSAKIRQVKAMLRDKERAKKDSSSSDEPSPKRSKPSRVGAVGKKVPPVLPFSLGGKGRGKRSRPIPEPPSSANFSQDEPHAHYFGKVLFQGQGVTKSSILFMLPTTTHFPFVFCFSR